MRVPGQLHNHPVIFIDTKSLKLDRQIFTGQFQLSPTQLHRHITGQLLAIGLILDRQSPGLCTGVLC